MPHDAARRQLRGPRPIRRSQLFPPTVTTMKTIIPRCLIAAAALLVLGQPVRSLAADEARATVNFENPEKFSDLKDSMTGTDKGREYYLKEIRKLIEEQAQRLPVGQKLTITFTDIDMAGDYLPAMASGHDVRVVKDIYPPRMKFTYRITDAADAVVNEGQENLTDLDFMHTPGLDRNDTLFYEKALLRDWLRGVLRK